MTVTDASAVVVVPPIASRRSTNRPLAGGLALLGGLVVLRRLGPAGPRRDPFSDIGLRAQPDSRRRPRALPSSRPAVSRSPGSPGAGTLQRRCWPWRPACSRCTCTPSSSWPTSTSTGRATSNGTSPCCSGCSSCCRLGPRSWGLTRSEALPVSTPRFSGERDPPRRHGGVRRGRHPPAPPDLRTERPADRGGVLRAARWSSSTTWASSRRPRSPWASACCGDSPGRVNRRTGSWVDMCSSPGPWPGWGGA